MKILGRPRIYTDEERKQKQRDAQKRKYYRRVGYSPGERPVKPNKHNHPNYSMWYNAKKRAKNLDMPFNLILEEIQIPEKCPLLDIPLSKGVGTPTDHSPTLDRIIPQLGYIKSNTWVISMKANRIKNDASVDELELLTFNLKKKIK